MSFTKFLFRKIQNILSYKSLYLTRSLSYRDKFNIRPFEYDYVRHANLFLCYEEILSNNVKGNVAELGVYQGDFAQRLNQLFADRTLYLFDTFEGFSEKDVAVENQKDYSSGDQDFSNTSIELVRNKMAYPEKCIFKKGWFPQSAIDIEDSFCFVSLDADLYEPIYQGLQYFFPRLEKGGYIFVHDFNNQEYKGTRQAVIQFCNENNISYVPIVDNCGTAIISK